MLHVLIVEDDFRVADLHEQFLSKVEGVKATGKALSGREAIDFVKKNKVDLVLMDIYIPDMLGTELISEIRDIQPNVDVIMISAATDKEMVETTLRNGVFDYILKPVKMKRFLATIEKYKSTKHLLDEKKEIDQTFLDEYFGYKVKQNPVKAPKQTPKGIDPITLEKVRELLLNSKQGVTAEEMGEKMGASRTTARRYLEYLIANEEGHAELEYGIVGRPERKYYLVKQASS